MSRSQERRVRALEGGQPQKFEPMGEERARQVLELVARASGQPPESVSEEEVKKMAASWAPPEEPMSPAMKKFLEDWGIEA